MNRRDFIKALAGIPLLGFLKPEAEEIKLTDKLSDTDALKIKEKWEAGIESGEPPYVIASEANLYYGSDWVTPGFSKLAVWNGSTWKEISEILDGRNGQYVEIGKES
jgi:hypothetical protein